ncbi:MAG: ABC transporter ATP-binding protein [Gemmatimonadetes bacterium]|nr:ABC transporter ATP-binding protein [Gemmatimonadota bacterium]
MRLLDGLLGAWLRTDAPMVALRNVVVVLLAAIALKNVAAYAAGYWRTRIQESVARDLRLALYGQVQRLGLRFFQGVRGGRLVAHAAADADQAKTLVGQTLTSGFQNGALVLVYLGILFALSWRLTLLTLVLAPALTLLLRPVIAGVRRRLAEALDQRGELAAVMSESVEGARLVKAHGAEAYERGRFAAAAERCLEGVVRAEKLALLAHPLSETLGATVVILVLLVGTLAAVGGQTLRPELVIAFLAVTLRLLPPVKALSQFPAHAEHALAAADRVFAVLDHEADDVDPPSARPFPGLSREIAFERVWVAYEPGRWVLRDVTLTVRRGEVVAIVGPSGAGKSTLVDLLPRFVEPARGEVLVDGVRLSQYERRSIRRHLGLVSQHTVLFNDTVRANIAYGDQRWASDAAVEAAARAAHAHAFIERLPRGYQTVLGERGMRLSGGERQRIAIARALLRDPPLLILDEATSSLDVESERLVQQAIARLLEHRTVFVIAHRLSTVARADQIVVLDQGRVVEQGRHAELIRAGGLYRRLVQPELELAV